MSINEEVFSDSPSSTTCRKLAVSELSIFPMILCEPTISLANLSSVTKRKGIQRESRNRSKERIAIEWVKGAFVLLLFTRWSASRCNTGRGTPYLSPALPLACWFLAAASCRLFLPRLIRRQRFDVNAQNARTTCLR